MRGLLLLLCAGLLAAGAVAGTIYVDAGNTTGVEDGTAAHPFNTIQEGLNASGSSDTVIVAFGLYKETIVFPGHDLTLTTEDPYNPAVGVEIDGDLDDNPSTPEGPVVTFAGTETDQTLFIGFDVMNGYNTDDGGGIVGNFTSATIRMCGIIDNVSDGSGGGMSDFDGLIDTCRILYNEAAADGGGLHDCCGTITDCDVIGNTCGGDGGGLCLCDNYIFGNTIEENEASGEGGGLSDCGGLIWNNRISVNAAGYGGGLAVCDGTIDNNVISGNVADTGGGICDCLAYILRNTITGNVASVSGGGMSECTATFTTTCILWGNHAPIGPQYFNCDEPECSCIEGWGIPPKDGNIGDDPLFIAYGSWSGTPGASDWTDGDYHLSQIASGQAADSPCVDTGAAGVIPDGSTRTDGQPDIIPCDMGFHYNSTVAPIPPPPHITIILTPNWNLIGYAHEKLLWIDLADCTLFDGADTLTWDDAIAAGWVATNIYYYTDAVGYGCLRSDGMGDTETFQSGRGYWLLSYLQQPLTFSIPVIDEDDDDKAARR